ncbi:MAG: PxxKW family cysteine-rich protein [Desulfosalsimonas sp.]
MICQTTRKGMECAFMTADGCVYNGGTCYQIVESCNGCGRTVSYESGWYCSKCPEPEKKWKNGVCNLATHVSNTVADTKAAKINPIKASKRGAGKK